MKQFNVRATKRFVLSFSFLMPCLAGMVSMSTAEADESSAMPPYVLYGYEKEPYPLDSGPHLFIDWRYILPGRTDYRFPDGSEAPRYDGDPETLPSIVGHPRQPPWNIRIEAQPAEKTGPVLPNDQAWEYILGYNTLLHWEGKYRLWYETIPPRGSGLEGVLCYAESDDAINWVKPNLGLIAFKGDTNNNIVYGEPISGHSFHGSSVFVDPKAPAEERLKLVYMVNGTEEEVAAFKAEHPECVSPDGEKKKLIIRLAASGDGIHWRPLPDPLMIHMSDTQTRIEYDPYLDRYVGYYRLAYMNHRAIGRTESKELKFMPVPRMMLFPEPNHDSPGDDYYINGYSRYPGTKTMHLMAVSVFKRFTDSTDISLAGSLDGRFWSWIPGGPILEPGAFGEWDGGCIFGGTQLTELPGDRVGFPYQGYAYPHKFPRYERHMGAIGLAVWEKERLAALVADEDGEFVTTPLSAKGDRLFLNFKTMRNGYVKVAVEGKDGRSLGECDPLFGDALKQEVTWNGEGGIGVAPGESFDLRIRLRSAKLYSFEIK